VPPEPPLPADVVDVLVVPVASLANVVLIAGSVSLSPPQETATTSSMAVMGEPFARGRFSVMGRLLMGRCCN
jgi:hypothetical protein